jgi:hypothetical protein
VTGFISFSAVAYFLPDIFFLSFKTGLNELLSLAFLLNGESKNPSVSTLIFLILINYFGISTILDSSFYSVVFESRRVSLKK